MSKFMYFDFRCVRCDHVFEDFVKPDVQNVKCPECPHTATRLISAPTIGIDGKDPDFPTAWDKWAKTNKAKTAEDKKFQKNHGVDKKHHSYGS